MRRLGPGVITGAADDDPSGIATYSQAGAHAGFGLLWTVVLTWPLMVAVQSVSARIGRVTGRGLAAAMTKVFPRPVVSILVVLLVAANTVNVGADLAAMGAAAQLVLGGDAHFFALGFAVLSLLAVMFIRYHSYVRFLKWLTLSLLAYVGVVFAVSIDWATVAFGALVPAVDLSGETLTLIVAVLGTTISPYLFFWESAQEVEEEEADPQSGPLLERPEHADRELNRIGWENWTSMAFSNLVAFSIMLTAAVTLHQAGFTDIRTSGEAAAALRPIAGEWAFLLFSLGIIGTGLLAVPVLAGSAAYAVGETYGWRIGLERTPRDAAGFYGVISGAIAVGVAVDFSPLDPIRILVWSAVLNGVIVVPLMAAMMIVAGRRDVMGTFPASRWQMVLGWAATAVMAAAVFTMFVLI